MSESWQGYVKLCSVPDIGAVGAMRLLRRFGSPEAVFGASREALMSVDKIGPKTADSILSNKDALDMGRLAERMRGLGAEYIHFNDARYPRLLAEIPDMPVGFYKIGAHNFNSPCISIIGSRLCTVYGQLTARKFAAAFARAGFTIVSGMARGIDSAAHMGAIEAGGKTVAVLGCGADVVYPPENIDLYKRIIENGAVVSEFPLGARADKQCFPIRNRIVSGLSVATLVVESDTRGGSMITARLAAEQGRDVFAIPGRIDSPSSRGCNALIRDGVTLATSPEDILESLSFSGQLEISFAEDTPKDTTESKKKTEKSDGKRIELAGDESAVFQCFEGDEPLDADSVAQKSGLPISKCLAALLMLEIKKLVAKQAGGVWTRKL